MFGVPHERRYGQQTSQSPRVPAAFMRPNIRPAFGVTALSTDLYTGDHLATTPRKSQTVGCRGCLCKGGFAFSISVRFRRSEIEQSRVYSFAAGIEPARPTARNICGLAALLYGALLDCWRLQLFRPCLLAYSHSGAQSPSLSYPPAASPRTNVVRASPPYGHARAHALRRAATRSSPSGCMCLEKRY